MRWLINEWHDFRDEILKKVEEAPKPEGLEERVAKLEGEIRAMKARMGKKD
jgi:uncharacterized small protein (DUF1192 family)